MTAKKGKDNGITPIEEQLDLNSETAQMLSGLFAARQQIDEKIQIALTGAGMSGKQITGGVLEGDNPHLTFIPAETN